MQSNYYITNSRLNGIRHHHMCSYEFGGDSLYTFILHAREALKTNNPEVIRAILTRVKYDFNLYL